MTAGARQRPRTASRSAGAAGRARILSAHVRCSAASRPSVALTLYTDATSIRGTIQTRQRGSPTSSTTPRSAYLVLSDATRRVRRRGDAVRAEFAQVNLASVLFAVVGRAVGAAPELRTPKNPEEALISIPPFRITGRYICCPSATSATRLAS